MPKPASLTLGLLPERKRDWRTFAASYGLVTLLILLLLTLRLAFPDELQFRQTHVTELIPLPRLQAEAVKVETALPAPPVVPLPPPPSTPKLVVPKEIIAQPVKPPEPPKIEADFKPPQLQAPKTLPPRLVYTGSFGSSAQPTLTAPVQKVQTGGFGDPAGLSGSGKDSSRAAAKLGSFDLPDGAGQGNGTGGAKGLQGTVASAGFGNGIAVGDGRSNNATVQSAGFGAQELAHASKPRQSDDGPPTTPVEITSKPNPVYTDEARQLKIEGEVLLEVMFGANGQLHVDRVVRGLGHGLDEAAVAAANKIQFKPAARNGVPVDSTSIVHVTFQLAY
jgi:TonB family protein